MLNAAHSATPTRLSYEKRAMCPRGSRARAQRGFTLIEILIVVTLIAAISVLLMATIGGGMDGLRLRSAAKEIASELRHARAQAMAKSEVQTFTIDPEARQWSGAKGRAGVLPKKLDVVFVGARELQPRRGEGAIVFFEDGASSGGRIQLKQDRAAWNIDVAWLTGEVSLHRARVDGARAAAGRDDNRDDNRDDEAAR
jgi:general secretion pathway protein H